MKKRSLFAALLAVFLIGAVHAVLPVEHAHAGIVDSVCGSPTTPPCGPNDLKIIANKLFLLFASVGTALLFVFMISQIIASSYLYMFKGDAGALARARSRSFNMLVGYVIIIAVFGGLYLAALRMFGVDERYLKLLQFFSEGFVQHAYAQTGPLVNPLPSDSAYDIIIAGLSLAMRFFIYPSLIVMWVASGFKLVYSQGNPEGLKTARKWFLVSFIVTIIAFTLQGFILAFRETALRVFQNSNTQTVQQNPSGGATIQPVTSCVNQPINTLCTVAGRSGRCGLSREGVYGCYVEPSTTSGTAPFSIAPVSDCTGQPLNRICTTGGRNGLCGNNPTVNSYACNVGECFGQVGVDGICYSGGVR